MYTSKQCIVYITDFKFAFPTMVSAAQSAKYATAATKVLVYVTERMDMSVLESVASVEGYSVYNIASHIEEYLEPLRHRFTGRLSVSALGRLLLSRFLPPEYESVIYIDGDTQICDSLAELEVMPVHDDTFLACLDCSEIDAMFAGRSSKSYFNSGVLKFNRRTWIGEEAYEYYVSNPVGQFHDQRALNAVAGSRVRIVSSKWNFPKKYLHFVGDSKPSIVHFMAHPKPWHGAFFPVAKKFTDTYVEFSRKWPELSSYWDECGFIRKSVYKYRSIRDFSRNAFGIGVYGTERAIIQRLLK